MDWLKDILSNLYKKDNENNNNTEENIAIDEQIDEDEIIAVISAAIAAVLNRSTNEVVVRSIRRIPSSVPVWNQVARQELTSRRF